MKNRREQKARNMVWYRQDAEDWPTENMEKDEDLYASPAPPYDLRTALKKACRMVWNQQDAEPLFHRPFLKKWGPFDHAVLLRLLREGDVEERRCALFTLGYLATSNTLEVVRSYLYSQDSWERWASALVLGERREPSALALLPSLLVRGLGETARGYAAREVAMGDDIWSEMRYRNEAVFLLAKADDPQVIPFLRGLLQTCWHLEQEIDPMVAPSDEFREMLIALEDHLAYALGQLQAWGALLGLDLPVERVRIGLLVLLLGALRIDEKAVPIIFSYLNHPIMVDQLFRERAGSYEQLDWEQITHILLYYFGLSAEEQARFFEQVHQDIYNRSVEPDRVRGNPSEEWTDWDALNPFA